MREQLREKIAQLVASKTGLSTDIVLPLVERPKTKAHGDFAFPCFLLAKKLKKSPADCCKNLAAELPQTEFVAEVVPIGPFLNFKLNWSDIARNVLKDTSVQVHKQLAGQKILLEYSSPNIAKPFHVGHLRATLIGNALDRVFRYLGADVESINHLGDWGTQFGFVWAGCEIWGKPENPSVDSLVDVYRKASELKKKQEDGIAEGEVDINQMARSYFAALENKEAVETEFWSWCRDISLQYLNQAYQRLGVEFNHFTGESFYEEKLAAVSQELKTAGVLSESRGAWGIDLGEELGFARILTPDGRSLYLTRDIAAVFYREETFQADKVLYVVGAPQTLHFSQLKGVIETVRGKELANKLEHIPFGHVAGMSTRGGQFIELSRFLDEAKEKALTAYRSQVGKRPEGLDENSVAEAVSLAAIFFSTLNKNRLKDVEFSWKHSLEFQGDTGPYVLYAYARLSGIFDKAKAEGLQASLEFKDNVFSEKSAEELFATIIEFETALLKTAQDREPSHLSSYVLNLAKAFSRAYNELKVLGADKDVAEARLALFQKTKDILGKCLELLGLRLVERM